MNGLGEVAEYLHLQQQQRSSKDKSTAETRRAKAAAAAAAAAADKTGYTPSLDDMFRMNRQQLEEAARTLSRDDSLAPERKAYLMQHLLAARWICAQQRRKQLAEAKETNYHGRGGGAAEEGAGAGASAAVKDGGGASTPGGDDVVGGSGAGAEEAATAPRHEPNTASAALALAGAKSAASFREEEEEGGGGGGGGASLCQPIPSAEKIRRMGCKHYARGARLVAACCGAAHVCRFCHDEAEDHTIDRYATTEMVCMACSKRQPSAR